MIYITGALVYQVRHLQWGEREGETAWRSENILSETYNYMNEGTVSLDRFHSIDYTDYEDNLCDNRGVITLTTTHEIKRELPRHFTPTNYTSMRRWRIRELQSWAHLE